ncbi:MAG: calcium-binding protein [Planctomycetota bacterium]
MEPLEPRRLLAAGDPITSFGIGGTFAEDLSPDPNERYNFRTSATLDDGSVIFGGAFRPFGIADDTAYPAVFLKYTPAGGRDTTFGDNGRVDLRFDDLGGRAEATDLIVLDDGDLLAIVEQDQQLLIRLNPDGTLDVGFGDQGLVNLGRSQATFDLWVTNERIHVGVFAGPDFAVEKFLLDGTRDTAFAGGPDDPILRGNFGAGAFTGDMPGGLSDGSFFVVGRSVVPGSDPIERERVLLRFNADGTPDAGFGVNGRIALNDLIADNPAGLAAPIIFDVEVGADDRLLFTGLADDGLTPDQTVAVIARYDADLIPDSTFSDDGVATYSVGTASAAFESFTQSDGSTLVRLFRPARALILVRPDGTLDPDFGTVDVGGFATSFDMAVVGDEVIVAAGSNFSTPEDLSITRLRLTDDGLPSPIRLVGDVLEIDGTDNGERIRITEDGLALVANRGEFGRLFPPGTADLIRVRADAGDDIVTNATAISSEIFGGGGADKIAGGSARDTLFGEGGRDFIDGGTGSDLIVGGGGNDQLRGQGGDDRIYARGGNDYVDGGTGDDRLEGNAGNDLIRGGRGNDQLTGGTGLDRLEAGPGNDDLFANDGEPDELFGGTGDDTEDSDINDVLEGI